MRLSPTLLLAATMSSCTGADAGRVDDAGDVSSPASEAARSVTESSPPEASLDSAPSKPPPERAPADAVRGRLVVFSQPDASALAARFADETLPALRALAEEMGVVVTVLDPRDGAPPEVAIAPLLVYQNHRGRSVFQGRYADVDRVRNFLRTSRRVPQGAAPLVREDLPAAQLGRAVVCAPVKVTDLAGAAPADGGGDWRGEARAGIADGLERMSWRDSLTLGRADRAFYMDFYPYLSEDGTLFVSTALFSQFHCKTPVHTSGDAPASGPWSERRRVFADAAAALEDALFDQLAGSDIGDGFDAVAATTPSIGWDRLGLPLPPAPEGASSAAADLTVPLAWTLVPHEDPTMPQLVFHFPPPLDMYGGEVGRVEATLRLGSGATLDGAAGSVRTEAASVTLGDVDLDKWVHGPAVLQVSDHGDASFEVSRFASDAPTLSWGALTTVLASGRFTMRDVAVDVDVRAQLEPVIDAEGESRLLANGTFTIPLAKAWEISVPVGDPPENETLVFDFDFTLAPAGPP